MFILPYQLFIFLLSTFYLNFGVKKKYFEIRLILQPNRFYQKLLLLKKIFEHYTVRNVPKFRKNVHLLLYLISIYIYYVVTKIWRYCLSRSRLESNDYQWDSTDSGTRRKIVKVILLNFRSNCENKDKIEVI